MKLDKKYLWDYDTKSIDLSNPNVLCWYIARKINFGDWRSLDKKLIKKYLNNLDIDSSLKTMLRKYYAQKRTKNNS